MLRDDMNCIEGHTPCECKENRARKQSDRDDARAAYFFFFVVVLSTSTMFRPARTW